MLPSGTVRVSLPMNEGAGPADPYVFSALSLRAGRSDMVEPGRQANVAFGIDGGYDCTNMRDV